MAAGAIDPEYLEILLDRSIAPDKPAGTDQMPPIFTAMIQHRWPQVELLLASCYNLNWTDEIVTTAATYAAAIGNMSMAVYFLEQGFNT